MGSNGTCATLNPVRVWVLCQHAGPLRIGNQGPDFRKIVKSS